MKLEESLLQRSENKCELCQSAGSLKMFEVQPLSASTEDNTILICEKCRAQIEKKEELNSKHWSGLTTSMWSEVRGIRVVSWRMLKRLSSESWASDNLDMMYLDDETLAWAKSTGDHENDASVDLHKDSNGAIL